MLSQRTLEAFQAVMDAGSVTAAAHVIGVSQPAVSRLLRELEERTGLVLFDRCGNRIVPTEAARALSVEVQRSLVGLSSIEDTARRIALGLHVRLDLAAMPALATTVLPDIAAVLHDACARIDPDSVGEARLGIEIQSVRGANVLRAVRAREVRLGFVTPLHEAPDVLVLARHAFPFECVMPTGHELESRSAVAIGDLSGRAVVGHAPVTATGRMLDRLFATLEVPPRVATRSPLSPVVSALALRGLGVAIVDPFTAADHRARGGTSRPFDTAERFLTSVIAPPGDAGYGNWSERVLDAWLGIARRFDGEPI